MFYKYTEQKVKFVCKTRKAHTEAWDYLSSLRACVAIQLKLGILDGSPRHYIPRDDVDIMVAKPPQV